MGMTREEAISKLYELIECTVDRGRIDDICYEVIEYLEAQEPRVMSLKEVDMAFEKQQPVWLEIKDVSVHNYHTVGYRLIRKGRKGQEIRYEFIGASLGYDSNYGITIYGKYFRCWTSRPDEKRRAETPWN